ncbi:allergen Bla g 4-like [Zootermopsis nevadensis]|uniref:Lipocalin/cytosolic fatty-acid binding domain-containing protein n=1 Tax=Zootermopsis nevadensis TaxID=136037 RepID=A0A067RVF4_ZOONE|nr:allergen Bla g 4-like [Zootermopsis nevadensis]KDR23859.1 hypothetical protein L798_11050 [Zootermopsis nevadensis]
MNQIIKIDFFSLHSERRRENSTGVVKVSDNVLDITYPNRNEWSSAYYVAATDYDQYSIVVGCPEITGTEPNVYVMFRSKNPNELARKAAEDSLKTYNLDIKDFYKEC